MPVHPIASVEWSALTRNHRKIELYERETYFREGRDDAERVFGTLPALREGLHHAALVMLKADGLVAGKLGVVHDFVRRHGFTPVAAVEVTFNRLLTRELWRFQLTSATLDRLAVNDCVHNGRVALLLALRGEQGHALPATVRLSSLKGSAILAEQASGSLRSLLGQPNRVFSFVHVADEPADFLRELGLLLEPTARRRVLAAVRDGRLAPGDADLLAGALARDAAGGRSLDPAEAIGRVTEAVRRHQDTAGDEAAIRALGHLKRMRDGGPVDWRLFTADLADLAIEVDGWDLAVLGTSFIEYDEAGQTKLLGGPDLNAWLSSAAH